MESGHWYVVVCFLLFLVVVFGGGLDGSGSGCYSEGPYGVQCD